MTAGEVQKSNNNAIHVKYTDKFADKLPTFLMGAGTLAAALTWNDFSRSALEHYYPKDKDGKMTVKAKFVYALIFTLIIVGIIVLIELLSDGFKETFGSKSTNLNLTS